MNNSFSAAEKNLGFSFASQTDFSESLKDFDPSSSLFGRIIESSDYAFNELSLLFYSDKAPDLGTLLELFVSSAKESGRFDTFLSPFGDKSKVNNRELIELLRELILDKNLDLKENTDNLVKSGNFCIFNRLSEYFRLRHALRLFIEICVILKSRHLISNAENQLNELDLFIYNYLDQRKIAKIANLRSEADFELAKFAELCSWAIISKSFSSEKSSAITNLLSALIFDDISSLGPDSLGLSASAFCLAGNIKGAVKCLTQSFNCRKDGTLFGWDTYALTGAIFGISPDYFGLKISPASHFSTDGLRINRNFRRKKLKIQIRQNSIFGESKTKILLNGEEYPGSIIHVTDLRDENDILLEIPNEKNIGS